MATYIKDSVFYSAAIPATEDAAGFQALTWTRIPGPIAPVVLGLTGSVVGTNDVELGRVIQDTGYATSEEMEMLFRRVSTTTVEDALRDLAKDGNSFAASIRVVRNCSGAVQATGERLPATGDEENFAYGRLRNWMMNVTSDPARGWRIGFTQESSTIYTTVPV